LTPAGAADHTGRKFPDLRASFGAELEDELMSDLSEEGGAVADLVVVGSLVGSR
jgi:hypothetical protein